MENVNLESENWSELNFKGIAGESEARLGVVTEGGTVEQMASTFLTCGANGAGREALYKAVIALSRSIAGHTDLRSLLSGVAESLRRIVAFDPVSYTHLDVYKRQP